MRARLRRLTGALAACVIAALACSARPLPGESALPPPPDAGVGSDAGDVDIGPPPDAGVPPGLVDWGVPIGSQPSPAAAGATVVKAVVPTDDGGAIVAGSFTGMVAFAADAIRDGTPGAGFVARYRRD